MSNPQIRDLLPADTCVVVSAAGPVARTAPPGASTLSAVSGSVYESVTSSWVDVLCRAAVWRRPLSEAGPREEAQGKRAQGPNAAAVRQALGAAITRSYRLPQRGPAAGTRMRGAARQPNLKHG
jgi:hypothetical protein